VLQLHHHEIHIGNGGTTLLLYEVML